MDGDVRIGGAIVAYGGPVDLLDEVRDGLAVLWDIHVALDRRGGGIGSKLFGRAVEWAQSRGCNELKIETQNVNVGACRFYAAQGCELRAIHPNAYPELPDEVQLLWYLDLDR